MCPCIGHCYVDHIGNVEVEREVEVEVNLHNVSKDVILSHERSF